MGDLYAQAYKKIQEEAVDTHQALRLLLIEVELDGHSYHNSLWEKWCTKEDVARYRQQLDKSIEAVLQYVNTNYQRKVKDA